MDPPPPVSVIRLFVWLVLFFFFIGSVVRDTWSGVDVGARTPFYPIRRDVLRCLSANFGRLSDMVVDSCGDTAS